MKFIKFRILVLSMIIISTKVIANKESLKEDSSPKPPDDPLPTNTVVDVFIWSQYLAHALAYDTSSADTYTIPLFSVGQKKITSATDIKSKAIDGVNYEGRVIVGKSITLPNILVIIFRGTDNLCNGIEDARISQVPLTNKSYKTFKDAKVHEGFMNVYKSLRDELRATVLKMLKEDSKLNSIFVTGHSLGGALANLCAVDMDFYYNQGDGKKVIPGGYDFNLVTFGSPRVGDAKFANYVNSIPRLKRNIRVINQDDIVSQIPVTSDFIHAGTSANFHAGGKWVLGEFNKDGSSRLEVAKDIFDPAGISSYALNIIDLIDCNTSAWEAFKNISSAIGKIGKSGVVQIFKKAYQLTTDSAKSKVALDLIEMGKQHSGYQTDIYAGFMRKLNALYDTLAKSNGKILKKKYLRKIK